MATSILLRNGTVLSHDGDKVVVLKNHDILIVGNTIRQIGQNLTLPGEGRVIDCTDKIVSPGFIDTHHHLWQTQLKGRHGDEGFMDYMVSGGIQAYNYSPEDIFWGQLAGCLQSINAGVTTVVDHAHMTYSPENVTEALRATTSSGLRSIFCYSAIWRIKSWSSEVEYDGTLLPDWWHATLTSLAKSAPYGDGRVSLGVGFDQFQLPKEEVMNLYEKARELGVKLMTSHYVAHFMKNSVSILSDYGLLDDSILLSHVNGISQSDVALLTSKGAHITTTPETEMQMLGEIVAFRNDTKSHASVGVDCHSNNSSDLLTQLRMGLQYARAAENSQAIGQGKYPSVKIKVEEAFNLGTIQGAKAINLQDQIGSLEVGKRADIVVFEASSPGMVCAAEEDPVGAVILHAGTGDVETVIVDGVVRKERGKLAVVRVLDGLGSPIIATVIENNEESHILNNYNGWINPEDLPPVPQCIVQQHHSTWLAAMTDCTAKQCTSHFAFICTHHQWLTEVSCLSTHFSPDLLKSYLPYCSRSVLSKAQLYSWVWNTTSRTWFVDVGDANELQNLSPASLVDGYADVDVMNYAPVCLTESVPTPSRGAYRHVMASCMFTGSTQNMGNAARPWEYSESLQSIIPLSYETVGYDLTGHHISEGSYFDKNCFCSYFAIDPENEPCSGSRGIDLTRERLWINATCGSSSLPQNWTDTLQTTDLAYIPLEDWNWPKCVADMPKQVIELSEQCVAEACEVDSDGYCSKIKPAVERACFCHNISYNSCGGSCQIFETRIDYVNWLRSMCGDVDDWHGLPDDWRRLAAPTALDMIPWKWTVKPSNITGNCVSKGWKLGSIALVNITTLLAMLLIQRTSIRQIAHRWQPRYWYSKGSLIAASQILANFINTLLVQRTPGYEEVPDTQLLLLWCTMPRLLSWFPILLVGVQPFEKMNMSAVGACLFAEVILQGFSSYYMLMTVSVGYTSNKRDDRN
ncbi:Amidohydrolase 1 [Penicillium occitanis (nom. inval.)]|nr:hypothetical protein PENOC_035650 [Penicillium occitanis (nom. inval.)]PCH05017.1 Amidohydrolase 1 [Penicillium occitanis (nom. inval.)]